MSEVGDGVDQASRVAEVAAEKLPRAFRFQVRRELKNLEQILTPSEALVSMAQGVYEGKQGLVVATDRRLVFFEQGMMRSRQEDFPLTRISSVQSKTGMASGELVIHVSGNTAKIEKIYPRERAPEIGDYVRKAIDGTAPAGVTPPPLPPPPPAAAPDPAARLAQLQALRDQGLISDEEMATRRSEIIREI